uniref:Nuclear receptor domain-containing protein n=1 Tax=Glossina palpalis gambiensis TaxID=67801 RepID=A0A1B0B574_9MUSC
MAWNVLRNSFEFNENESLAVGFVSIEQESFMSYDGLNNLSLSLHDTTQRVPERWMGFQQDGIDDGFFRRSIQKQIEYRCLRDGKCLVIRLNRNRCQYCRFKKCLSAGMSRDSLFPPNQCNRLNY